MRPPREQHQACEEKDLWGDHNSKQTYRNVLFILDAHSVVRYQVIRLMFYFWFFQKEKSYSRA